MDRVMSKWWVEISSEFASATDMAHSRERIYMGGDIVQSRVMQSFEKKLSIMRSLSRKRDGTRENRLIGKDAENVHWKKWTNWPLANSARRCCPSFCWEYIGVIHSTLAAWVRTYGSEWVWLLLVWLLVRHSTTAHLPYRPFAGVAACCASLQRNDYAKTVQRRGTEGDCLIMFEWWQLVKQTRHEVKMVRFGVFWETGRGRENDGCRRCSCRGRCREIKGIWRVLL